MMTRSWGPCLVFLTALAACSDDEPATPNAACEITERVRIAAPPADWSADATADYDLHVFGDLVLYTFDDHHDPERLYHRLDRCTGESAPFPSLTPGLQSPYVVDTAAGRVLYASKDDAYYIVDRLDVPGDDTPQKLADLPAPGWLDFNVCNQIAHVPYACYWREQGLYTHSGDPRAPALPVAPGALVSVPYKDAILYVDASAGLRTADPLTGASNLLMGGAQFLDIIDPGPRLAGTDTIDPAASPADAHVLWQPIGESTLYLRRVGDGIDIPLAVDPALAGKQYRWSIGGDILLFTDSDLGIVLAAVRTDTGATLAIPEHVDFEAVDSDLAISLTIKTHDSLVRVIWDPLTNSVHPWYRGSDPFVTLGSYDGESVDYYVRESEHPLTEGLWRVDLASGEQRQIASNVGWLQQRVTPGTTVVPSEIYPSEALASRAQRYTLEYLDLATGQSTPIADLTADVEVVPDEGIVYLDADGEQPGIWAAPLP